MSDRIQPIAPISRIEPIARISGIRDTDPTLYQLYAATLTALFNRQLQKLPIPTVSPWGQRQEEQRYPSRFKSLLKKTKKNPKVTAIFKAFMG